VELYPYFPQYVSMVWCLIKHRIRLHGVVLSYAQGQLYVYLHELGRESSLREEPTSEFIYLGTTCARTSKTKTEENL